MTTHDNDPGAQPEWYVQPKACPFCIAGVGTVCKCVKPENTNNERHIYRGEN